MPAGLDYSEPSLLDWQIATLLLPLHMVVPLCACAPAASSSYEDTNHACGGGDGGLVIKSNSLQPYEL